MVSPGVVSHVGGSDEVAIDSEVGWVQPDDSFGEYPRDVFKVVDYSGGDPVSRWVCSAIAGAAGSVCLS